MACDLTTGRAIGCYDFVGGVKAAYFTTEDLGDITFDVTNPEAIMTFSGAPEFFQYDLDGVANTFTSPMTKTVGNGTKFYAQTFTMSLAKMEPLTRNEFDLLMSAKPKIILEDYNGQLFLLGLTSGTDATAGDMQSGGARGDFNGYTATFVAEERKPVYFLAGDIESTTATVSAVKITP